MPRVFLVAATLALVAFRPSSAQGVTSALVAPGNTLVQARVLSPSRRVFAITSYTGCEGDSTGPTEQLGTVAYETRWLGDSTLLFIRQWQPRSVIDTTALDRRTLAPLWSRGHFPLGASASWTFRNRRVTWAALQPGGRKQSLDSIVSQPAFFAGTMDLLLTATPSLYVPAGQVVYSVLDLGGGPEQYDFEVDSVAAQVMGSDVIALPGGTRVDVWVVLAQADTYWIDKSRHEVVGWHEPQYESVCPRTFLRSSP